MSEPLQATVTGDRSQPFEFGAGLGVPSVAGGVESYRSPKEMSCLLFPAASVQLPDLDAFASSGPV